MKKKTLWVVAIAAFGLTYWFIKKNKIQFQVVVGEEETGEDPDPASPTPEHRSAGLGNPRSRFGTATVVAPDLKQAFRDALADKKKETPDE